MNEIPIACTLSAGDYQHRLEEIAALGREALIDSAVSGRQATLRFTDMPGIYDRLGAIVAAEARCCPFLDLSLSRQDGRLVLRIESPADGEFMLGELIASFRSRTADEPPLA